MKTIWWHFDNILTRFWHNFDIFWDFFNNFDPYNIPFKCRKWHKRQLLNNIKMLSKFCQCMVKNLTIIYQIVKKLSRRYQILVKKLQVAKTCHYVTWMTTICAKSGTFATDDFHMLSKFCQNIKKLYQTLFIFAFTALTLFAGYFNKEINTTAQSQNHCHFCANKVWIMQTYPILRENSNVGLTFEE